MINEKRLERRNILNMRNMGLNEIREEFLRFFESKGHLRLPSFSLVPENDPSILLINAGMTPLKPYFTGSLKPPSTRVTTCQKCIRTADIERVGKTSRHGTFFEMLGNFSFGDYFKEEAISWAWEFVTKVLKMPEDRLWVSIYTDDDEAFEIWNRDIGLNTDRIVRLGKEDNFWEHGTGPCGPCSEIYFDRGEDKGCGEPRCVPGCDCDRYVEFWNLVFTQFNKEEDGTYTPLQKKNIDTGLGLERLSCIMQGVDSIFEVDTIKNIVDAVCKIAGSKYGADNKFDVSIRIITDHIRSIIMMISDGILPSNEGRGYVLRRILRRAARHGKLLGINKLFLADLADIAIEESKDAYPELKQRRDYIRKVAGIEEEKFNFTVDQGLAILDEHIKAIKKNNCNTVSGEVAFRLHDTYGFPVDLTREIAGENGLAIDEEKFKEEMEIQKNRAREALKKKEGSAWGQWASLETGKIPQTGFYGYESISFPGRILNMVKDGETAKVVFQGEDDITVITDRTVFYAESGGQTGDTGFIETKTGLIKVGDCQKTPDGIFLHLGKVIKGYIESGQEGEIRIDASRRESIARNHTATHLIHKALKNILGEHVTQAGSLVEEEKLRFDFAHFEPVSGEQLKRIEDEVNSKILDGLPVTVSEMGLNEAKSLGAVALFGEKYGERVRIIKIGDYSMELCGGTHMNSTAKIGLIKILGETGIASGTRRIEAVSGYYAIKHYRDKEDILNTIAGIVKTTPQDLAKRVEALILDLKNAQKEIENLKAKLAISRLDEIASSPLVVGGTSIVASKLDGMDTEALRNTSDVIKNKIPDVVVILASEYNGKVNLVAAASKEAVKKGIHSGQLVKKAASAVEGGGGGRPDMAQAGGKNPSKIDEALRQAVEEIKKQLS
jgi:alanyl-tRNA synthetase